MSPTPHCVSWQKLHRVSARKTQSFQSVLSCILVVPVSGLHPVCRVFTRLQQGGEDMGPRRPSSQGCPRAWRLAQLVPRHRPPSACVSAEHQDVPWLPLSPSHVAQAPLLFADSMPVQSCRLHRCYFHSRAHEGRFHRSHSLCDLQDILCDISSQPCSHVWSAASVPCCCGGSKGHLTPRAADVARKVLVCRPIWKFYCSHPQALPKACARPTSLFSSLLLFTVP